MRKVAVLVVVVAAAAAAAWFFLSRGASPSAKVTFRTESVRRGEVVEGVAASGAVQPLVLVQVGTQVSGVIEKLFKDFNSRVAANETIAVLDSRRLVTQVLQDESNVGRARADAERAEALLWQAERDLGRSRALAATDVATQADLDAAEANVRALGAQARTTAAILSQSLAQLEGDRVSLRYATITSPIDGVIVSRNVDVGQTVAASLQAPTLFVIANDLTKVQVQASVPEADIGRIREGQRVRFNVDAHPSKLFEGVVSQVRLAPTTVQNVVTYTVLVDAENPRGLLLPGMTANATFETARSRGDALHVPVSATRQSPPAALLETTAEIPADGTPAPPARVYLRTSSGRLRAVAVRLGVSDGAVVAVEPIETGALREGSEVVTMIDAASEDEAPNPFTPRIGRPGGRP